MINAKRLIELARKWQKMAAIKLSVFGARLCEVMVHRNNKMISAKKLIKLARKWQKLGAIKHKKIALPRMSQEVDTNDCSTSSFVEKGHFVVYSADQKRFMLPLEYLKKEIVRQLFKLAEEEFGVPSNGPLILPCDAVFLQYIQRPIDIPHLLSTFLEYITPFTQGCVPEDLEKALLTTLTTCHCSAPSLGQSHQEALICGY
ncbi:hypothetical protein SCA6_006065 [Theobroma cacao]